MRLIMFYNRFYEEQEELIKTLQMYYFPIPATNDIEGVSDRLLQRRPLVEGDEAKTSRRARVIEVQPSMIWEGYVSDPSGFETDPKPWYLTAYEGESVLSVMAGNGFPVVGADENRWCLTHQEGFEWLPRLQQPRACYQLDPRVEFGDFADPNDLLSEDQMAAGEMEEDSAYFWDVLSIQTWNRTIDAIRHNHFHRLVDSYVSVKVENVVRETDIKLQNALKELEDVREALEQEQVVARPPMGKAGARVPKRPREDPSVNPRPEKRRSQRHAKGASTSSLAPLTLRSRVIRR